MCWHCVYCALPFQGGRSCDPATVTTNVTKEGQNWTTWSCRLLHQTGSKSASRVSSSTTVGWTLLLTQPLPGRPWDPTWTSLDRCSSIIRLHCTHSEFPGFCSTAVSACHCSWQCVASSSFYVSHLVMWLTLKPAFSHLMPSWHSTRKMTLMV